MPNEKNKPKLSKRQAIREERKRREKRKRLFIVLGLVGASLIILGLVIFPTIQTATAPVGDFVKVTPTVIPLADGNAVGDPESPIRIEVYEDFKCPACRNYTQNIEPQIIEEFASTGEIYYIIYNYPFLDDQNTVKDSDRAAYASQCAVEQDRFWDYHNLLYTNFNSQPNEFSDKRLLAFAESLGLDMEAFTDCLDSAEVKSTIREQTAKGEQMGVTGTPTIFINGKDVKPGFVPSFEEISAAIDQARSEVSG